MTDALKDCFLVFLAAAFAFLTNYYLIDSRSDRAPVAQEQPGIVRAELFHQSSDRGRP
jgi:hypothetical protein